MGRQAATSKQITHRLSRAPAKGPTVFIEKQRSAMRLVALSREAVAQNLEHGLTLADARARVPNLVAMERDMVADADWLERLADFCDRYTPLVALDEEDGLIMDITGCAHLFGGEAALREDLAQRLTHAGMTLVSALAGTPDAARAIARFGGGAIVPAGNEPDAAAPLSVDALDMGHETARALSRAGLATLGDLASRPRTPLAARFGQALPTKLARLLGEDDISITPRRPLPPCTVERRFGEPIGREEDVMATLAHLMGEAGSMLEARGEGGRAFELSLFRTDGAVRRLRVETSLALRQAGPIVRLFQDRIDTLADPLDPGFGYDLIRLAVLVSAPFEQPQVSLDGHQAALADIAALIDRLTTRLGREAVLRFVASDTHIPERAVYMVPAKDYEDARKAQGDDGENKSWPAPLPGDPPSRPIHLFEHPQPIEAVAEIPDGPPLKFRWRRVLHEVARAEGPERIAPEWWQQDTPLPTRDYYRVEDADGRRFWLFREGLYQRETNQPSWVVHGVFA
ncbi:MAG: DNA polymerase Y family protein [Cohaesibacteraceae bacterium]